MDTPIEALFERAGCDGQLCGQALDGSGEAAVRADERVVAASVIKVPIALEAETRFADGRLDPCERVTLTADSRPPGPTGFSLFQDDAEASLRDLVVAMLTISDNHATDALLHRVGIDAVNARMAQLGLTGTVIEYDMRTLVDSIGQDAGFADWAAMIAWSSQSHTRAEEEDLERRVRACSALTPAQTNRTTSREMVRLLRLIWSDQAGPAQACLRVRQIMRQQLTRHGSPPPSRRLPGSRPRAAPLWAWCATRSASSPARTAVPTPRLSLPGPTSPGAADPSSTRSSEPRRRQPSPA